VKAPATRTLVQRRAKATRESLLQAAIEVFATRGLHGGSVSRIAELAHSHDRMIYYYFGNKEGLFVAALEEIYRQYNQAEAAVTLSSEDPIEAITTAVIFFVRYFRDRPEFVTVLNSENLHRGKHISRSLRASEFSKPAVGLVDRALRLGQQMGAFRQDIRSRDVYVMISAMGYFYQSNQYTLSAFLGEKLSAPAAYDQWESFVVQAVLRTITCKPLNF
jgi:TetR/AcrR family transcriptional regulator, upper aerobic nicotinate degradation pathway regulator